MKAAIGRVRLVPHGTHEEVGEGTAVAAVDVGIGRRLVVTTAADEGLGDVDVVHVARVAAAASGCAGELATGLLVVGVRQEAGDHFGLRTTRQVRLPRVAAGVAAVHDNGERGRRVEAVERGPQPVV